MTQSKTYKVFISRSFHSIVWTVVDLVYVKPWKASPWVRNRLLQSFHLWTQDGCLNCCLPARRKEEVDGNYYNTSSGTVGKGWRMGAGGQLDTWGGTWCWRCPTVSLQPIVCIWDRTAATAKPHTHIYHTHHTHTHEDTYMHMCTHKLLKLGYCINQGFLKQWDW